MPGGGGGGPRAAVVARCNGPAGDGDLQDRFRKTAHRGAARSVGSRRTEKEMKPATVLALGAALLAAAACSKAPPPKAEEIRPVRVVKVGASSATRAVEYAGEVRPRHETRLSFRVGGKLVERMVEVGTRVRPGQPVARLDQTDLILAADSAKAQMASLEAERNLAESELKRYSDLREKNFISQAEYDRRASAYTTADATLGAVHAQYRQAANQPA